MTVCIATDGYPPQIGGIATFNRHLTNLLTKAGHRVVVLYPGYNSTIDDEDSILTEGLLTTVLLKQTYIRFKNEWQPYFKPGGYDAPNWIAIGLSMREWLMKNHKEYGIDIIEASDYGGCGIFLIDKDIPPVLITGHGSLLQYSRFNYTKIDDNYKVVKKLEEFAYRYADSIIAHSPLNKEDLEKITGRNVDFARIPWTNDIVESNMVSPENNNIVVIGGMQPIKGIYDTIKAASILHSENSTIKIHWIGGDTWLAPKQKKMSTFLSEEFPSVWQVNFKWHNEYNFEQTRKEIEKAAIVLIPSFFETFNYVAIEAAGKYKPIIITNRTGASYIFNNEKDALIIPANNPQAIADAILYLQKNELLRIKLGNNSATTIKEHFNYDNVISDRIKIYEKTIKNRQVQEKSFEILMHFLNHYKIQRRKIFYRLKAVLKKLVRR